MPPLHRKTKTRSSRSQSAKTNIIITASCWHTALVNTAYSGAAGPASSSKLCCM
jgi:hypothetical protein